MRIKEESKKRILPKDFDQYPSQNQIKNKVINDFVILEPSEHLLNHNFREIHKDKWKSKHNFFV